MIDRIIHTLKKINPWHFLWIGILVSIIFGLLLNTIQSYLWWGFLSRDLLLIGIIDGLFVPLLVAPIVIYFILNSAKLEELNKALQLEIIKGKQPEENSLRESEALYRILFENAPVGIGIADAHGTLIVFNDAMLAPGGYARKDMAAITNVAELYHSIAERDKALAVFRKQGFLQQFPTQFKRRDGTPYDALLSLRPITYHQGSPCIQAIVEDITERKKIEELLQNNEQRYRALFEDSPVAICEIDVSAVAQYLASLQDSGAGDMSTYLEHHPEAVHRCASLMTIIDMNTAMLELFGAKTKEELRKKSATIFHEESYDLFREDLLKHRETINTWAHEAVAQTLAGEKIHVFMKWFSASENSEKRSRVIVSFIDITGLKRAEKALKESEDRFRLTLHNSPIVVFTQDRNLRFTWIYNPRHGHAQENVIGKTDADVCAVDNLARLTEIKQRVIESGVSAKEEVRIEYAGKFMYYDSYFEPLYDPDGSIIGLTGVAIDITKRKQDEDLIRSYQEQLSLMASQLSLMEEKERRRIATDLHDNIGQILACAKLKLGELDKACDADFKASLRQIYSLVDQSISFTRSLTAELSTPILYEMGLEPAVAWLGREFQKNHSVQFHLRDDGRSKPLNDDVRIILFKSIRELLTNVAKHAQAKNVTVSLARNDGAMQVTVEDDGVGFDSADVQSSAHLQSCFGLFSIREALKNSGGSVGIVSTPGRGIRITLTAPLEK